MRTSIVLLSLVVAVGVVGCKPKQQGPTPEQIAQEKVAQALAAGAAGPAAAGPKVEVTAEGTELEPPITADRLPAGVWYCDMGTVHYARRTQGDGKCPRCGMTLTQKPGAAPQQ